MPFPDKGVVLLDLNGRIAYASTYFCEVVGVGHNAIAGMSCFDFVFPEDMDVAKRLLNLNRLPNDAPFRFRLRRKDGSSAWVNVQSGELQTAQGETYAISATITADIQSGAITP